MEYLDPQFSFLTVFMYLSLLLCAIDDLPQMFASTNNPIFVCWHEPGGDPSIPGNTIHVENMQYGRMGNHFAGLANVLRLGYCCKSKIVSMERVQPAAADVIFCERISLSSTSTRYFSAPSTRNLAHRAFCPSRSCGSAGTSAWETACRRGIELTVIPPLARNKLL